MKKGDVVVVKRWWHRHRWDPLRTMDMLPLTAGGMRCRCGMWRVVRVHEDRPGFDTEDLTPEEGRRWYRSQYHQQMLNRLVKRMRDDGISNEIIEDIESGWNKR